MKVNTKLMFNVYNSNLYTLFKLMLPNRFKFDAVLLVVIRNVFTLPNKQFSRNVETQNMSNDARLFTTEPTTFHFHINSGKNENDFFSCFFKCAQQFGFYSYFIHNMIVYSASADFHDLWPIFRFISLSLSL